ncbi:hypothetical protein EV182_000945 [Spiromyces aspiralis]|uniref:Uncharacterized protein n=1 Tax=Spiromyces aspiralis TaxID=68401 RepID=A0ACC1HUM0_9FUNG|nr:hypothetical protein EV182_000945 [Spiromyces aspiralis]
MRAETTTSLTSPRNEAIKKWADYTEPFTCPASLNRILRMTGLKTAYDEFVEKSDVTIDRIMAALVKEEEYLRKGARSSEAKGRLRPEELLEAQFAALIDVMSECLEAEVPLAQLPAVINKFRVGGNTHMLNSEGVSKKRVDIALVRRGVDSTSWFDILLNIEVKSDADRILSLHRGQYAWYAVEGWPRQVRHYLLGGVLARSHLYVYYNNRNCEIYEASVGKLLLSKPNERVDGLRNAVTFILFLLTRTETELGFTFEDAARDIHTLHIARPVNPTDRAIVATTLEGLGGHSPDMAISGLKLVRQLRKIVGHASWLFKGTCKDAHGRPDIYVKFDAQDDRRESEIRVMDRLKAHGVQHSAQLIEGFELKKHNGFRYELLALEDHGEPIDEYFVCLKKREMLNADVVRTVVQQILTALGQADSDEKLDKQSNDPTTGTVIFMSICVLQQFPQHTNIDNIKSLFHILARKRYIDIKHDTDTFTTCLFKDADLNENIICAFLKGFKDILFDRRDVDEIYEDRLKDPREAKFDELTEALEPLIFERNGQDKGGGGGGADVGYRPGLMLPLRVPETPSPTTAGGTLWGKWVRDCDIESGKENQQQERQQKQRQTPPQDEVPKGPTARSKTRQHQAEQQRWAKGKRQT